MAKLVECNWDSCTCTSTVQVLPEVYAIKDEIVENRRWFHQYPELSFEELKTAAKVVSLLKSYGITEVYENIGRTGVGMCFVCSVTFR